MRRTSTPASPKAKRRKSRSASRLDALIEKATIDAYDESEQKAGFFTMLENHLAVPFATEVLGMTPRPAAHEHPAHRVVSAVPSRWRAVQSERGSTRKFVSRRRPIVAARSISPRSGGGTNENTQRSRGGGAPEFSQPRHHRARP